LICKNLRKLQRLKAFYLHGIRCIKPLKKLKNLEDLHLLNSRDKEGDEEMMTLQRDFYKILPKLKKFATNGFVNHGPFYESIVVDCKNVSPCALETCYANFEDEEDV